MVFAAADKELARGVAAIEMGWVDVALACFQRACALDPDSAHCQAYRAWARYQIEDTTRESARRVVIEALLEAPDFEAGFVLLGTILLAEKRPPEARRAFKKALALNPDNAGARMGLSRAK